MTWQDETVWERSWWGNCVNSYGEEEKQFVYAKRMGLKSFHDGKSRYNFGIRGKILDIGGGPVSMLLKCPNAKGTVIDPCEYPLWVEERYKSAGIHYVKAKAESLPILSSIQASGFDEVWFYNVLQHTEDPALICANALQAGKIIRMFEWVDTYVSPGHPHVLTEAGLNVWLNGIGKVENIPSMGRAYYGIFIGSNSKEFKKL